MVHSAVMREELSAMFEELVNQNGLSVQEISRFFEFFSSLYDDGDKFEQIRIMEAMTYILRLTHEALKYNAQKLLESPDKEEFREKADQLAADFRQISSFLFTKMADEYNVQKLSTVVIFVESSQNTLGMDYFGLNPYFMRLHNELYATNTEYAKLFDSHVASVREFWED